MSILGARELEFASEEKCYAFLRDRRWPDGRVRNPRSGALAVRFKSRRRVWVDASGAEFSLCTGTAMERTRLPLRTWLTAIRLLSTAEEGISTAQFARLWGLRVDAAFHLLAKVRTALALPGDRALQGRVVIGSGILAAAGGVPVLVAIEAPVGRVGGLYRPRRLRLRAVRSVTTRSLAGFLGDHVQPGTTVVAADPVAASAARRCGYRVLYVSSVGYRLGRVLGSVGAWLDATHGAAVSRQHLQLYLAEWAFRANHLHDPALAFRLAVQRVLRTPTLRYRELAAVRHGRWHHVNPPPSKRRHQRGPLRRFSSRIGFRRTWIRR